MKGNTFIAHFCTRRISPSGLKALLEKGSKFLSSMESIAHNEIGFNPIVFEILAFFLLKDNREPIREGSKGYSFSGTGCLPVSKKPKCLPFLVSNVKGTATGILGFKLCNVKSKSIKNIFYIEA